jgi:carbamoyltransferase
MELYLGINFEDHDTAVFFMDLEKKDVFAISTERITRFKHDKVFPIPAMDKYLEYSKIDAAAVTRIVCGNPKLMQKSRRYRMNAFEREMYFRTLIGEKYLKGFNAGMNKFNNMSWFVKSLFLLSKAQYRNYRNIEQSVETGFQIQILQDVLKRYFPNAKVELNYFDHEECHAISSYVTSPFNDEALLITMDGHGDHNCFSRSYVVSENGLKQVSECTSPEKFFYFTGKYTNYWEECSIGGMYTYFTYMLGFTPHADEGKVEALAAFGTHNNEVFDKLSLCFKVRETPHNIDIEINKEETELLFSQDEFNRFIQTYKKEDICAAIQKFLEEIMLEYIGKLMAKTGIKKLCFSGGVFANVILNLRVFEELTSEIYIIPAMADDGSAEGACYAAFLKDNHKLSDLNWMKRKYMPYYGTSYSREQILKSLEQEQGINIIDVNDRWPEKAAELVAKGQVGAIFHGRMEWGPRALGNRSIIAACNDAEITKKINGSIKNRPLFQPFCPSILEEERERLFEKSYSNKHMTCAFRMKEEHRNNIPASVHIDGTGRAQFVEEVDNPMYYRYLKELKVLSGYGVSINTSFNKHGRTIVETPKDAIRDFLDTNMDFVIIEGYLILRK